ncbi:hypothetical protein HA402_008367 [Bradysia odoriphaga]|nr:hypothetical protein HA402_008367 [Bradysia odoriphaga]
MIPVGLDPKVLEKNRSFTEDFTKLYLELESEGCFTTSYTQALIRLVEVFVFTGIGLKFFSQHSVLKAVGFIFILIGRVRAAFLVHEIAHFSYTGHPKIDRIMASLVDGFFVGLSGSRWRNQHNRHHAMPQRLNHDIDLETMPLLAYNAKVIREAKDGKGFLLQNQAYLFVFDTLLVGMIWTLYQDPKYVLKHKSYVDFIAMIGHYVLYFHLGFWTWLFCLWGVAFYFVLTFSLNHTFLPVTTEPTHWIEYALHHTADVQHEPLYDWATGYLNYQIEHHLFPTIPNFRLSSIKHRVRALAKKHNISYHIHTYPEAVRKTFNNLSDVSEQVKQT